MKTNYFILAAIALFAISCGPSAEEKSKYEHAVAAGDSTGNFISSSAAVVNKSDTTHKFIRTADMKFKVKNVLKSTLAIEAAVAKMDGFVTCSDLKSEINSQNTVLVSEDSSLTTTYFTTQCDMIVRVPVFYLDSALNEFAKHIQFLDYRVIRADDVSLMLKGNTFTTQRINRHEDRLKSAVSKHAKKLGEPTDAEEDVYNKEGEKDNAALSTISLNEKIKYSTICLKLYQNPSMKRELQENEKNISAYEPGIFHKAANAFHEGWIILTEIFLFLFRIWGLVLLGIVSVFLYKKFGR